MARTWTHDDAHAPGIITLPDGARVRLDRPSVGAIPHVFADIQTDGPTLRLLIEPRTTMRIGDHLFSITALRDYSVSYRISHVHEDHQPLLQRLSQAFSGPVAAAS